MTTNNGFGGRSRPGSSWGGGRTSDRGSGRTSQRDAEPAPGPDEYTRSSTTRAARKSASSRSSWRKPAAASTTDDEGFESSSTLAVVANAAGAAVAPDDDGFVPQTVQPQKKKGPSLKMRAVDYLSRREHSRQELTRKLNRIAEESDDVEALLDSLEKEGWLSTERFTQSLVHRRSPGQGVARIVQELRQHGVDAQQIAEVKQSLQGTELERAREVWTRRYGEPPTDASARGKQTRFLMSRGFSYDVIRKVLSGAGDSGDLDE